MLAITGALADTCGSACHVQEGCDGHVQSAGDEVDLVEGEGRPPLESVAEHRGLHADALCQFLLSHVVSGELDAHVRGDLRWYVVGHMATLYR